MIETISQLFLNTFRTYDKPGLLLSKDGGRYEPHSSEERE